MHTLLIVDDNDIQHELFRCFAASAKDVELLHAISLEEAVDILSDNTPDIILLDNQLTPHRNCAETLPSIRKAGYDGKVVVMSSCINKALIDLTNEHKADKLINKCEFNFTNFGEKVEHFLK